MRKLAVAADDALAQEMPVVAGAALGPERRMRRWRGAIERDSRVPYRLIAARSEDGFADAGRELDGGWLAKDALDCIRCLIEEEE